MRLKFPSCGDKGMPRKVVVYIIVVIYFVIFIADNEDALSASHV